MTLMTALPLFTALMMYYAPATLSVHIFETRPDRSDIVRDFDKISDAVIRDSQQESRKKIAQHKSF